jgi:short-subunit dehydrogenase
VLAASEDRSVSLAPFSGRTVLVTGASQGIGKAVSLALAPQRPKLVLAARDREALASVASTCRDAGAETLVVPTDVTRPEDCSRVVAAAVERFSGLDVLVNNAGASMWARFDELQDLTVYETLMRVNYLSCVYLTHAALPHLRASRGRLVAVASLAGLTGVPTRSGYAASKHAVFGFFDSLRIELAGTGVTVTVIAPDFVVSEIHRRSIGPDGRALGDTPMQEARIMTAEECAARIVEAMSARRRLAVLSWRGRVGRFVRLVAPGLIDRIAARAVARGR